MIKGTFLGRKMSQSDGAINLWEKTIARLRFKRLLEIGTYNGNFSHYLMLLCEEKKADFETYDIIDYKNKKLTGNFHQVDVFAILSHLELFIKHSGQSIVFCDGGDKAGELRTFSQYLKSDDIIIVHDWNIEVFPEDVPNNLIEIYVKECESEGYTRMFKKIC